MNPADLARAFQEGRFEGPEGALSARRALVTRKSLLLFTDDLVLKVRRPRLVDGWNQASLALRQGMTGRERWLGRQLNRGVYLEDAVLSIDVRDGGPEHVVVRPAVDDGEPVVLMRRIPDEARADTAIANGLPLEVAIAFLEQAVMQLAVFHASAECHTGRPFGDARRPRWRFEAALEAAAPALDGGELARLSTETGHMLDALDATFAHRIFERRIRVVHGEMRLEHIFFPEVPGGRIAFIDPHDGAEDARAVDIAEEAMSLALELDIVLGSEVSDRVMDVYAGQTADASLRRVARFYKRLGCLLRAGEAVADAADDEVDATEARARARFYVDRALSY